MRHCGQHECPRAVGPALPGVRARVRRGRDRPGTGRGDDAGPPVRAAAPGGLVGGGRAERSRRPAARGGAGLWSAEPGPAARCADHRLRPAAGGVLRRPPVRPGRLAWCGAGDRGAGRAAGADGRRPGRAEPGGLRAVPAAGRDRGRGGRAVPGRAPDAPAGAAQRAARRGGGPVLRDGLGVHQIGGGRLRHGFPGRPGARPRGHRAAGGGRAAAVAGGLPGRRAHRAAGHRHRGQPGGRRGGRHLPLRGGFPVRGRGHGGGAGQRRARGVRTGPAHRRTRAHPRVRWRPRGRGGTSAGRCRSRSRAPCASRSAGGGRWCCQWIRSARSAGPPPPAARP